MTPLPPPTTVVYTPGPNAPDYMDMQSKEGKQERTNVTTPTISTLSQNPGVVLSKDGLDVPLEFAFQILNERTGFTRPSLMPLFRTRYVAGAKEEEPSAATEYQKLRDALNPEMKQRLSDNEKLPLAQQDPSLIAFDQALRFEAVTTAIIKYLGGPDMDPERAVADAANFKNMPEATKQNMLNVSQMILNGVDSYLVTVGPNDPAFVLLSGAAGQIKEAMALLNES